MKIAIPAIIAIISAFWLIGIAVGYADSGIEWNSVPVEEVTSIEDADFFYADPGMCWGITWNGPQDWTVEIIIGEYEVERVLNTVDFSPITACSAR